MEEKIKIYACLSVSLFLIWVLFTSSFCFEEVIAGLSVSLILSLLLGHYWFEIGLPPLGAKRFSFFLIYLGVLFWEIIKANFDVASKVLHPKMSISPGIIVVKTELKQDLAKMILANSITLTPGTFTVDILDDNLLVHWIDVKTKNINEATRIVGGRFEKYLKVVFE